ncbi:response regulator transcription factor [Nocardia sp. NPDC006044]|uniref:response regulator transcription factor n=1 Tax=Nocardia sp. NPDC006044 TaxID=3364306 RepID=UPI0036B4F002
MSEQWGEPASILVVSGDPATRLRYAEMLRAVDGHVVDQVESCSAAVALLAHRRFDLIVAETGPPAVDAVTLCRSVRTGGDRTGLLLLTAPGRTSERVLALEAGADDCLGRPFDVAEFQARARALVRRVDRMSGMVDDQDGWFEFGGLQLVRRSREARRGSNVVAKFTNTEFAIIEVLAVNAGIVLSREAIAELVWGAAARKSNVVAVYLCYIRRKLADAGCHGFIHTIPLVGYQYRLGG